MTDTQTPDRHTQLAMAIHECSRIEGGCVLPHWEAVPPSDQEELVAFVGGILQGRSPEQQHEAWFADMVIAGWKYGEAADPVAKTDPDLVHWEQYTAERRNELRRAAALIRILDSLQAPPGP